MYFYHNMVKALIFISKMGHLISPRLRGNFGRAEAKRILIPNYEKILILALLFIMACVNKEQPLDNFFKQLESESSKIELQKFKNMPLDSVLINYRKFDGIFVEVAGEILKDSTYLNEIVLIYRENHIQMVGRESLWLLTAAFHEYLNNRQYDFPKLWKHMKELGDRHPPFYN